MAHVPEEIICAGGEEVDPQDDDVVARIYVDEPIAPIDPEDGGEDDLIGGDDGGSIGDPKEMYCNWLDDSDEATSLRHYFCHYPKNKKCPACMRAKIKTRASKRRMADLGRPPLRHGESVAMDHIVAHTDNAQSLTGDMNALCIYDRGSRWTEGIPLRSLGAIDAYNAVYWYEGRNVAGIEHVYCDDSEALKKALSDHGILHDVSVPGKPVTNGVAERQVQEVINGTRVSVSYTHLRAHET